MEPDKYLRFPARFAKEFGMNPDDVFKLVSFDTIKAFWLMWKREDEFRDRYTEAEKLLNPPTR